MLSDLQDLFYFVVLNVNAYSVVYFYCTSAILVRISYFVKTLKTPIEMQVKIKFIRVC